MILLLLLLLSFQEPAPEQDLMEEVMEAVDQVKQGFLDLDRQLHASMKEVDASPEGGSALRGHLQEAATQAGILLQKMEALLGILPEREGPSGGSGNPSPGDPQDSRKKPGEGDPDSSVPRPSEEDGEGSGQPGHSFSPGLLLDPRPGAWGSLPPRLQDALRQASTERLPLKYRRWLKAYHRRQGGLR